MYRAFFGLREQPFNLTPDPKFLYLNTGYREALAAMRYGISGRKGFVSLVGEAGTGKTTLLRCLLAELGPEIRSVLVLNPAVGFEQLLRFILTDLGKVPAPGMPKLALLQALNAELLDTLARGGNVVVLIDEAQDLAIPVLEELRLLSNLETAKEKILQLVLVGQPELDAMLARPELRQLRQRIAVPARLRPLARRELVAYIAARIAAAGGDGRGLFTAPALYRLWRFSRGVPRLLNLACDNALVTAYAAGTRRIGWKVVGEAAGDLHRPPLSTPTARRLLSFRLVTIAAAAAAGVVIGTRVSQLVANSRLGPQPALVPMAPVAVAGVSLPAAGQARPDTATTAAIDSATASTAASTAASGWSAAPVAGDAESVRVTLPASSTANRESTTAVSDRLAAVAPLSTADNATGVVACDAAAPPEPRDVVVRVTEGDFLARIARCHYGSEARPILKAIQRANPELIDLDAIRPGQAIVLPGVLPGNRVHRQMAACGPAGETAGGARRAGE
jgi:general secretion pathway protein A